ncbi:MAG: biopolymer transporter Tol [Chthoniobacterales bacterium]
MSRTRISNFQFPIVPLALAPLLCLTSAMLFAAEDVPTITVSKGDQINIAVPPLAGGEGPATTKVLQNDLALSGYFKLGEAGSSFTVRGTATGGSLQGEVVDHGGGTVLAKSYSGSAREKADQFANDIVETLTGHRGIAGTKIAFIATRSGKKEVYVAECDGSNVRQLTHDNTISVHPSLSPDGRRLAYTGYQSGYADVYLVDLARGARDRIVNFPGTNSGATFSPDGNRLALTISKDGNPELYTVSTNGGGARRLTHTRGIESGPTWSPDGNEIIYSFDASGGPQLYRILSSGGEGQRISTGYGFCTEPDWSPDGKKVAFNVRSGGEFQIAVLDLAGGGTRLLSSGQDPVWGADSRHLIFSQGGALYMLDTMSGRKNKILDGLGKITEPSWAR